MKSEKYDQFVSDSNEDQFSSDYVSQHLTHGLSAEVGEVMEIYQKYFRDQDEFVLDEDRILDELGDVLWYVTALAIHHGSSLGGIQKINMKKLKKRMKEGK